MEKVSIKPVRVQRNRQQKQTSPNGLPIQYCGRPSKYGNPFVVEASKFGGGYIVRLDESRVAPSFIKDMKAFLDKSQSGYQPDKLLAQKIAVAAYRHFFHNLLAPWDLNVLTGHNLSCWCRLDAACHVDVLLEKVQEL